MKKFLLIPVVCLFFFHNSFSQNYNWITPNKIYLKMYVADSGMYRINKLDFTNAGISTIGLDPRTVKVYNKGFQIPIYFNGQDDGSFDANDYFDFYGTRNYGGPTITYDHNNAQVYVTSEYYNLYSDTNTYWADWGGANGMRFITSNNSTTALYTPDFFYDFFHFEKDLFYSIGETFSSFDFRNLSTEKFRGEGWYWKVINDSQTISDSVSLPLLFTSPQSASLRIFAYPTNRNTSIFNEHIIEIKINGTLIGTAYVNDLNPIDTTMNFSSSLLSGTSTNNVSLKYISAGATPGAGMFVDMFELKYPKKFKFQNNKLAANLNSADSTSKLFRITGYNFPNPLSIFDVSNNIRITGYNYNLDTLKFTGKNNASLVIVNETITKKPFRIKQRLVPNLVSNSIGADYLLIYNKIFLSQAEQLKSYRQSYNNFRSFKSEIEDIYDIFNYGQEAPVAVKNFTRHVYENWPSPKLSYICLFGRGSVDPKKNMQSSAYYNNFVPVYGNPHSDGYFANINTGTFFYYDQIAVGRLPAFSVSEAQTMVDKIIAYDNEPVDQWVKTFSYITGGGTSSEQSVHQGVSNTEINNNITPPPISSPVTKIYRNDDSSAVTYNFADSIKNTINRGCIFVNYRGHAGSHNWEVGMQDPNVLSNGNKLPMVVSLTCFTGENSKGDFRGFGEKFIYLNNKGAIGFIGTTGWSYQSQGNEFGKFIIETMRGDTTRIMGNFLKKVGLRMSRDSSSFSVRHTVNCYNLIGDPAVKLKLPPVPEFVIRNNDYKLSNESNVIGEPITLKIFPKNFGLYADSCKIRFQLKRYNQNHSYHDTVYRAFRNLDTVLYNFKIDSNGVYSMVVTLDQDNWYPNEDETNNSMSFGIALNTTSFIPISPINNSIVFSDSVQFTALNPNFTFNQKSVKVILDLDTSIQFNSALKRTFVNNNVTGPKTRFKTRVPLLNNNTLYYWRSSAVINNDTSRWPIIQTFIYNDGSTIPDNGYSDRYINETIPVILTKRNRNQFSQSDFVNTNFANEGIKLNQYSANLYIKSYGSNAEEASYFSVGDKNVFIDGGVNTGLNILKVRKLNGQISGSKNLKMNTTSSSDSLINYLNTFDSTYYMMLLNAAYFQVPGGVMLSAGAKSKLRQFGSIYCDSIGLLSYFHTWSLIGFLGASHSQTSEMFDPCCRPVPNCNSCNHWSPSFSSMNVLFTKTSGTVSNIIGPARTWTDFSWNQSLAVNSTLKFDVIGIDVNGYQTVLFPDVQTNKFVDLSSIDAYQYPKLNLFAKLNLDTILGTQSSVMNSLNVNYSPAAELVLDKNSLQITSSQKDNNVTNFSFDYHNAGFTYIFGTIINVYSGANLLLTDTVKSLLKIDSAKSYSNSFTNPVFRDSTRININIKPQGNYNEFYSYNNSADFKLTSTRSGVIAVSKVEVSSDGKTISNGDYVRKNPEIKVNLIKTFSSSRLKLLSDTTQLVLKLNDRYVPYFVNGKMNTLIKTVDNSFDNNTENRLKDGQGTYGNMLILYYPELQTGSNRLSILYKDEETGNDFIDTITYDVFVSDEFMIKDFYNYPNPMKNETNFIFNLAGLASPEKFRIKIYTVSGRLIKEIDYAVNIGYNQILWDGKDNDGDYVSNGTYLYKLITQDETNSNKTETQVQKLVVLR
ncbi:MAG: C25 family cysteine peptidase [Bacteroidota bacterium]|nr:C25 family cysteine peptidase [Bacteroidota bacterium]